MRRRTVLKSVIGGGIGVKALHHIQQGNIPTEPSDQVIKNGDTYHVPVNGLSHATIENGSVMHDTQQTELRIDADEYERRVTERHRGSITGFHRIFTTVSRDPYSNELVTQLLSDEVENELLTLIFFTKFVPYALDHRTTTRADYTRYPVQTLVDWVGDCKDAAVLLNALASSIGYDVGYAVYPNHVTPVIHARLLPDAVYDTANTFTVDDVEYLPIESSHIRMGGLAREPETLMFAYTGKFTVFNATPFVEHTVESLRRLTGVN